MLSKDECIQAISVWKKTRTNFSKIKQIIDPSAIFKFTQKDCFWIKKNNKDNKFHAYIGVYNNQIILIIIPLNEQGREIKLNAYLTTVLTDLRQEITLIETDILTTVSKTKLSENLEITKRWKEVDSPKYSESTILERASVNDIEKWKYECLDWFYYQCKESGGKNIFRAFTVPFPDLVREDGKQDQVAAFFGLKYSSIYQTQLPLLVFVTIANESRIGEIIRVKNNKTTSHTNTRDWSHPCPPMCIDKTDYTFIDS